VARVLRVREFGKREAIFLPSREPSQVFLLLEGCAKITRTDPLTCRELILFIVRPGELFGLPALTTDRHANTSAVALERSRVGCMNGDDFERLARNSEFSAELNRLVSERLARITERLDELVFRDVHSRLARLLLRLAHEFPREQNGTPVIDVPLTQQDLADLIGSTRESANIAVNDFKRQGLIDIRRRFILIRDPERLRALSP